VVSTGPRWLARQYLLERAPARAIEHLGGMQSQAPLAPYAVDPPADFAPDELSALTEERQVVRLHLMRNTVASGQRARLPGLARVVLPAARRVMRTTQSSS